MSRKKRTKKRPCWVPDNHHYNKGPVCKFGDQCRFDHANLVPKSAFENMERPKPVSKGDAKGNPTATKRDGDPNPNSKGGWGQNTVQ